MAIHSEYISPQFSSPQKNEMKKEALDTDEEERLFRNSIFNGKKSKEKENEEVNQEEKEEEEQRRGYKHGKKEHEKIEKEEEEKEGYNIFNSLSVKEMSDEEINSENEYNTKLKKKSDFTLNNEKEKILGSNSASTLVSVSVSTSASKLVQNDTTTDHKEMEQLNEDFQRKKNKWIYGIVDDTDKLYLNSEETKYKKESDNNNNKNGNGNNDDNLNNNKANASTNYYLNGNIELSKSRNSYNVDEWINKLLKCELLHSEEVKLMCELLINILKDEENCVQVRVPVTVAGDIHGQFYDLLELFHIGGLPPDVNYLFLGDYVDRGYYSCECFCLVACFKIKYPSKVTMLRGNHESRQITKVYGFYDECMRKYNNNSNVWKYLTDAFDYLPLTAIINDKIFCDHGGISPHLKTIEDINKLNRFNEIPQDGAICDLLWSDPAGPEEEMFEGWKPSPRGAGVLFSETVTTTFLRKNNLCCICRAHQLVQDGYQWMQNDKVVTIFSAPNYCYRCGNSASLMFVDEQMEKQFITFNTAPLRASAQTIRRSVDYML